MTTHAPPLPFPPRRRLTATERARGRSWLRICRAQLHADTPRNQSA